MNEYVKMTNGTLIADVYNSEETIKNAIKCGYDFVKEVPKVEKKEEVKEVEKVEKPIKKTSKK